MNILLGEISSYKAIVIAKYIKLHYNNVLVYTYDFLNSTGHVRTRYSDRHFIVFNPQKDLNKYLTELSNIVNANEIDFFIPVNSNFIGEILKNRQLFGNSLCYYGPNSSYEILNNKNQLAHYLQEMYFDIMPRHYLSIENATIPFVYKPQSLSSAKGIIYFFSEKDRLEKKHLIKEDGVIQQYIKGRGIGFSCFAINGEIKEYYSHLRLIEFPLSGGSSLYRESYHDDRLFEIVSPLVKKLNWSGFAMFEFKLTDDNLLYLIEVNPRVWGSINQGLMNGANYFSSSLGTIHSENIMRNYRTYVSPLIYYAFLRLILKFKFRPILLFIKNIRYNIADVSIFKDFGGFLSMMLRKI